EPSLARALKALGIQELNEVQKFAEKEGLYSSKDNIALMSQSRTGKTFAGILFIANEIFKFISKNRTEDGGGCNEVAIFVAPFHASARETAATISRYFGWFLRPLVLFRGVEESDILFRLSKGIPPNIIIATPDALREFLRYDATRKWLLERELIGYVFDDIHSIIHDPLRGLRLFEDATFLKETRPDSRLLVLSGEFEDAERLEPYFGVRLVKDTKEYNPPELKLIQYKNTKEKAAALYAVLHELADTGVRTLVYMNSIESINTFIETEGPALGAAVAYDLDSLIKERLKHVADILGPIGYPSPTVLNDGVGVYHGLQTDSQRWFIEWAFRRGYLRFLFGTEALGYGVTAPVSHVVMSAPGMDEVFRQSMMARAIRLRRGKIRPGRCTVFTKTIEDVSSLERVYNSPKLPVRFIDNSNLSNLMLGLVGHGVVKTDEQRKRTAKALDPFFKKGSTTVVIKMMMDADTPFMEFTSEKEYAMTPLGNAAFTSSMAFPIAERILEGLKMIDTSGKKPTEMDLLLILNHSSSLIGRRDKSGAELSDAAQDTYLKDYDSTLAEFIIDTELESTWRKAVEFSLVMKDHSSRDMLSLKTRKTKDRLRRELHLFLPNFTSFLVELREILPISGISSQKTVEALLKLITEDSFRDLIIDPHSKIDRNLRFKDLSFIDFGNIEQSISETLTADLTPMQKARLIDLLETVQHTTMSFVSLLEKQKDNPESREVLDLICDFSQEGVVGRNLVKALEEEGVIERGTLDGLWHKFSTNVEDIQKRTDAPAKAASVLFSLFTGDVVGLATSSIDAVKVALGRTRKVDTSKIS
ncbi:MAG: DEAD/DEAH box helicase, partial [Candidatus Thorarchaeota archaeon]